MLWTACSQEEFNNPTPDSKEEEEAKVTLSVKLPGANNPATKGADVSHEDKVETIDVFVFKNGELTDFDYGRDITDISEGSSVNYSLSVTLKVESNCDLMVLINTRDIVENNFPVERLLNRENPILKEDFTQQLTKSFSPATGWNTQQAIPMWGMKKNININGNTSLTGANSISASRMLARVNIAIDNSISTTTDFALKSVRVYNYNTVGAIIPNEENWNNANTSPYVTQPTLPQNQGWIEGEEEPILYTDMTLENRAILNSIYLFEAEKGVQPLDTSADKDYTKNPCIVIGGYYGGNTNEETFYRIDFALSEGTDVTYLDILRNHSYNITIQNINGPGKSSPEEAFQLRAENIIAGIVKWNDYDMDELWFDGQYYYAVSPLLIELWTSAANDNQIKVKTDYPSWSYELSDCPTLNDPAANPENLSWLELVSSSPQPGQKNPSTPSGDLIKFNITENELGVTRTAYMHIQAGGFIQTATIVQTPWYINTIYVTPTGEIPSLGETRSVVIEGNFPNTLIRVWDDTNDVLLEEGMIEATDGTKSGDIHVPTAWLNGWRKVIFEYYDFATQQWQTIRLELQEGLEFLINVFHQQNSIAGPGETISMDVTGSKWPTLNIKGVDENGDPVTTQTSFPPGSTTEPSPTRTITVDANPSWNERTVEFQWATNELLTWVPFFSKKQAGYNGNVSIEHGNEIKNTGQDVRIIATGYRPAIPVRAAIVGTTGNAGTKNTSTSNNVNNSDNTQFLSVAKNADWKERYIQFQWEKGTNSNNWIDLNKVKQPGYNGGAKTNHVNNAAIPGTGHTYTITAYGFRPELRVRAVKEGTETPIAGPIDTSKSDDSNNSDASKSITIPALEEWNTSRIIQFQWEQGKNTNKWVNLTKGTQTGYNGSVKTDHANNASIPRAGKTYQIQTTGYRPIMYVRAVSGSTQLVAPIEVPEANTTSTTNTNKTITIPNIGEIWGSRNVEFQWSLTNNGGWNKLTAGTQYGYNTNITSDLGTSIPVDGKSYKVKVSAGDYPRLYFRLRDLTNNISTNLGTITNNITANTIAQEIPVTINANNSGAARNIAIQWDTNSSFTSPRTINQGRQEKANFTISTQYSNRVVALYDAKSNGVTGSEKMTWAEAMGIRTEYNTTLFENKLQDNRTMNYTISASTGCGAYWEGSENDPKTGKGKWRLPTFSEAHSIRNNKKAIGDLNTTTINISAKEYNSCYWTNDELFKFTSDINPRTAYVHSMYMDFSTSFDKAGSKMRVRCVRNP